MGIDLRQAGWLTAGPITKVFALLNSGGEEVRVVGGAVRNALIGLPHGDIDMATTAPPEEVMARAKTAGIKAVPTGIDHGTVTLVVHGHPFEVTTLREDVETFGRKARVAFGRDWRRDAERRDFTMNALSASADGLVHDYVGGLDDLAARRVRFIGDPAQRIAEDYLRILRFFRVHAAYGDDDPDRAGLHACIEGRAGLAKLSAERVRMEIVKLMAAPGAVAALTVMDDYGLLTPVLGGIAYRATLDAMITAEKALGLPPDPVRRLGALAVAVTEDAERLAMRLRLSNAEAKRLDSMGYRWWRLAGVNEDEAKRRLYRLGPERYRDRLMQAWARAGRAADALVWHDLATLPDRWQTPRFPLRAADFLARGFREGKALGEVLEQAEEAWVAAGFPADAAEVKAIADRCTAAFAHDHRL
ncbi:MAG: CCA tRNA nucleotidyltransferase [Xanthobacteraceae bacterium]|nr:MAG: CCA tRNA nucleotidyltransferase [Xanthobacteraceae bacterium]